MAEGGGSSQGGVLCSSCSRRAVLSRRSSGLHLCREHFVQDFERRVAETVEVGGMIEEGERIAVALSGGKDSTALLLSLQGILDGRNVELVAVTVDEGIAGYRDDTITAARQLCSRVGVEQVIVSFREEFGYDLDEMVGGKRAAPCTYCGVFRKNALNRTAKLLHADRVATGHNLDDEAQTVMMNYLKGDYERLMRFRPSSARAGLVPRIKPLRDMPEKEIALYCMVSGAFFPSRECPYAYLSLRADVREMMNRLECLFPGVKRSTVDGFEKIVGQASGSGPRMGVCRQCGEPCVEGLCKACELLNGLKNG